MSDHQVTVEEVQRLADAYALTDPHGFTVVALRWAIAEHSRAEVEYARAEQALSDMDNYFAIAQNKGLV